MSITIGLERPDTTDVNQLIEELEAYLAPQYPDESRHGYSIEKLIKQNVAFFVLRHDGEAAGCAGVQIFHDEGDTAYGEVKRMYVRPRFRGLGFAKLLLKQLEETTMAHGVELLRLETGIYQTEAIQLYKRYGFYPIVPFGKYREDPLSLFFEKHLSLIAATENSSDG